MVIRSAKITVEDNMSVDHSGELVTERVINVYVEPVAGLRYIEVQVTVLPTGSLGGL